MSHVPNPYLAPLEVDEEVSQSWTPPPSVTNHKGEPLPPETDLFCAPPAELGEVLTAQSTLKRHKNPRSFLGRMFIIVGLPLLICIGLDGLVGTMNLPKPDRGGIRLASIFLSVVVWAPLAWYYTRFAHKMSYVGTLGVARCNCVGRRSNLRKSQLFQFQDAVELRTSQTRHYHNGIYAGTHYTYGWTDGARQKRFALGGSYYSAKGDPKGTSEYWLAQSAEGAWSAYLHPRMVEALQQQGFVQFNLAKENCVRLGPGFIEFQIKGEVSRLTPAEIKSLGLNSGYFTVKTHDARWFSRKGNFGFSLQELANSRLFLLALDSLLGYRLW